MTTMEAPNPIQTELAKRFASMMEGANRRTIQFETELEDAPQTGNCPKCGEAGQSLDMAESIDESVRRNRMVALYADCGTCEAEKRTQEWLARMNVPGRVQHATLQNYEAATLEQKCALADVKRFLTDREKVFLCLLGSCGTGKGHLAAAVMRTMRTGLGNIGQWIEHATLVNDCYSRTLEMRKAYLDRLAKLPILVLDEMGGKTMTADTPEIFYSLLTQRYENNLKTVLTGNIPYRAKTVNGKKVEGMNLLDLIGGERIDSRFKATVTMITCQWEDYRKPKK